VNDAASTDWFGGPALPGRLLFRQFVFFNSDAIALLPMRLLMIF